MNKHAITTKKNCNMRQASILAFPIRPSRVVHNLGAEIELEHHLHLRGHNAKQFKKEKGKERKK
jgi:hypothetical protein